MAATKRCKVCGREYEYCRTNRRDGIFRWQDVACSPEHGATYFRWIAESRSNVKTAVVTKELPVDDGFDALFEEGYDDGEEELAIEK